MSITLVKGFLERVGMAKEGGKRDSSLRKPTLHRKWKGREKVGLLRSE